MEILALSTRCPHFGLNPTLLFWCDEHRSHHVEPNCPWKPSTKPEDIARHWGRMYLLSFLETEGSRPVRPSYDFSRLSDWTTQTLEHKIRLRAFRRRDTAMPGRNLYRCAAGRYFLRENGRALPTAIEIGIGTNMYSSRSLSRGNTSFLHS